MFYYEKQRKPTNDHILRSSWVLLLKVFELELEFKQLLENVDFLSKAWSIDLLRLFELKYSSVKVTTWEKEL